MQSLDDAYNPRWRGVPNPQRVAAGLVLVGTGVVAVAVAMVLVALGGDSTTGKLYAGVAAGAGIPVMLAGVVVVLPASRRARVGVFLGTVLASAGVVLFWQVYPDRWTRTADPLAFETMMLYGLGCAIALWFVFSTLASVRLRNNPQGTVELEVVRPGETKTVQVSHDQYRQLVSDGGDTEQLLREIED